jgi:excisionase family DNA binding protein
MNQTLFTVEQVAHRLGVSDRTIRNMIDRGSFPHAYRLDPNSNRSPFRIPQEDIENIEKLRKRGNE